MTHYYIQRLLWLCISRTVLLPQFKLYTAVKSSWKKTKEKKLEDKKDTNLAHCNSTNNHDQKNKLKKKKNWNMANSVWVLERELWRWLKMAMYRDALIIALSHLLSLDLLQAGVGLATQSVIWRSLPTHITTVVKFHLQISITDKGLIAWIMEQISHSPSVHLCLPHMRGARHSDTRIYTDISEVTDNRAASLSASMGLLCCLEALLPHVQPGAVRHQILFCRTASVWSAPSCPAARLYSSQVSGFAFSFGGPCMAPTSPACQGPLAILPSCILTFSLNLN